MFMRYRYWSFLGSRSKFVWLQSCQFKSPDSQRISWFCYCFRNNAEISKFLPQKKNSTWNVVSCLFCMLVLKPEYQNLHVLNVSTQNSLVRNNLVRKKALYTGKLHKKGCMIWKGLRCLTKIAPKMRMQVISWHTCDHTINGYHWVRVACHLRLSWTLKNLVLFKIDTWHFQT